MGQTWYTPYMLNTNTYPNTIQTQIDTHTHRVPPLLLSLLLSYKTPNTPVAWESERIKPQKNSLSRFTETQILHKGMRETESKNEEIPYIASHLYARLPSEK